MEQEEKIRRLKKLALIALVIVVAIAGASYLVYDLLNSGRIHPLALLLLAAAISIVIPMIRSNFFPSARDCASEFAFHEQRLAQEMMQHISDALGPETLNRIFSQPGQYRASAGDVIEELLARDDVRKNPDLHCALLLSLARIHQENGDYGSSIPLIETALAIKPQQFVARMHLAGIYEGTGAADEACRHYGILREHPETLSGAMKKLVATRIKQCLDDQTQRSSSRDA